MSILVTGGAGYIGSFTTRALVEQGNEVVVFDDLSLGHSKAIVEGARLATGSLLNPEDLKRAFDESDIEGVIHFAALSQVGESVRDPRSYYRTNVCGTVNLIDAMADHGVKKIVFSSTAATYGNPKEGRVFDESHPQEPINPYGRSKLMIEKILQDAAAAGEFQAIALRYFNAAGALPDGSMGEDHNPETHLMPNIMKAALGMGGALKIFGEDYPTRDGTCVRDYIHVEDLGQAHLLAYQALSSQTSGFDAFNVGTGNGATVKEVIAAVESVTKRTVPYSVEGRREGDPAVLVANSEKLQSELGWKPKYPEIERIVQTVFEWFTKNPNGYGD